MGGGSRRGKGSKNSSGNNSNNKSKSLKRGSASSSVKASLFVEGGFLSDWSPSHNPGRNASLNNKSGSKFGNNSLNNKTGFKSGNKHRAEASACNSEFAKSSGTAIGYNYPSVDFQDVSCSGNIGEDNLNQLQSFVLVDSKKNQIISNVDQTPSSKPNYVKYNFVLGGSSYGGLGFAAEHENTPSGSGTSSEHIEPQSTLGLDSLEKDVGPEEDINCELSSLMAEDFPSKVSAERNSGFLSIGGLKLYTQDISDVESDEDDNKESPDEESSGSSEPEELVGSSESNDSEDTSDSDSDIDEEVAEDYLEGVGGSDNIMDAKWLLKPALDESDDDSSSSSCYDEALEKMGGIALQEASRECGMQKVQPWKKHSVKYEPFAFDDVMLEKDPRTISARKKHVAWFPYSWPSQAQKSKASKKIHGEKKKLRKERIAIKRRERMLHRGVDLQQINSKLEQIVLEGVDVFAFQPMHSRDSSQVQRLAAIYHLQSSSQGSGKKRFVKVMRTQSTSMPSSSGRQRLEKLMGVDDENADFSVTDYINKKPVDGGRKLGKSAKRIDIRMQEPRSAQNKASKNSASRSNSKLKEKKGSGQKGSYANQPVSFIASGTIHSETMQVTAVGSKETADTQKKDVTRSANIGSFEVHTTGFGSKMMAKMGYVGGGGGLGKNGQGMAEPIEVIQRPKSLGLGVEFLSNTAELAGDKSSRIGAFEKHTKGFGSKMMAKMGFVEGMGLGRESQGITAPLTAVRLPKSRGLGAGAKG